MPTPHLASPMFLQYARSAAGNFQCPLQPGTVGSWGHQILVPLRVNCTINNLRQGDQSSRKRTNVCVTAGPRDAACGETVRTELGSAETMRAQRALPAPALSERESMQGMTGRSKALHHITVWCTDLSLQKMASNNENACVFHC